MATAFFSFELCHILMVTVWHALPLLNNMFNSCVLWCSFQSCHWFWHCTQQNLSESLHLTALQNMDMSTFSPFKSASQLCKPSSFSHTLQKQTSSFHRILEWLRLAGPSRGLLVQCSPSQAGPPSARYPGTYPGGFWRSPRRLHHLSGKPVPVSITRPAQKRCLVFRGEPPVFQSAPTAPCPVALKRAWLHLLCILPSVIYRYWWNSPRLSRL